MPIRNTEQDIQKSILDYFNYSGVAVKTGSGAFKVDGRFVKMTTGFNDGNGWPDVVWVYKGQVYLCEIKTPKGRLSDNQKIMHDEIKKHGVNVFILKSLDDAIELKRSIDENL